MEFSNQIWIAGTGLAALATALRLVKRGYKVGLLEKNGTPGGRLNQLQKDGYTFDLGPTFFSMSYEFKEFAQDCGISLPFTYHAADPLYSVHFRNNNREYLLYRNLRHLGEQFADMEPNFDKKMSRYLRETGMIFQDTIDNVVRRNFDSIPEYLQVLSKIDKRHLRHLFSNFGQSVNRYFSSQEICQTLWLVAFFLGNHPQRTNGVYSLLSYIEFLHDGYHIVEGGMYEIVRGIVRELEKEGVCIRYHTEICNVTTTGKQVTAFVDRSGNRYTGEHFIVNGDAALFRGRILNRKSYAENKLAAKDWSMGIVTLYAGLDCKLERLNIHNYYLTPQSRQGISYSLKTATLPEHPNYYVHLSSRSNPAAAPPGGEALTFVIPVPNLLHKKDWYDRQHISQSVLDDFSHQSGYNVSSHLKSLTVWTPHEWENEFGLFKGAALGLSHSMYQTGILRPKNKDEIFSNLFYTGSSTVPGIGLPMAIISSRLTTERVTGESIQPYY